MCVGVKTGRVYPSGTDMDSANTYFSDTDLDIFIFGTDTGNTRILQLQIQVGYGARTTR
jgi:hypothetical protein